MMLQAYLATPPWVSSPAHHRRDPVDIVIPVPSYRIPATMLFAHPTRMADAWNPRPERIILPALDIGSTQAELHVYDGETTPLSLRRPTRHPIKYLRRLRKLDLGEPFILDVRADDDTNIAHQILDFGAHYFLVKEHLEEAYGPDIDLRLLFQEDASRFTHDVNRLLEIPVVTSDAQVKARIVDLRSFPNPETWCEGRLLHRGAQRTTSILPKVYRHCDFGADDGGEYPEKVFISRKNRRVISNEAEITRLLESRGFRKYFFEDIPILEQWKVIARAKQIVAIHGAAMHGLVFNRHGLARPRGDLSGLRIIELCSAGFSSDVYRALAARLNAHWCSVRGQITVEAVRELDMKVRPHGQAWAPFHVDPYTLHLALDFSATAAEPQWPIAPGPVEAAAGGPVGMGSL
jgi:hypothetical protein